MSFLSHIGLSSIDKLTGNALDKLGNAIKDGDVKDVFDQLTSILDGVEDKLGDVSDVFEDAIDDAKKDVQREVTKVKRQLIRETRAEMKVLHKEFGDNLAESMKPIISELVAAEVKRRMNAN